MNFKRAIALCLSLLLICLSVFSLVACGTPQEPTGVLYLVASKTDLVVNGGDFVTLSAQMVSQNEEISSRTVTYQIVSGPADIFDSNKIRSKQTSKVGDTVKVKATAGDISSNEITLTIVAEPSTVLTALAISASQTGVQGGTVGITVNKVPSQATATVKLSITSGNAFATLNGNNVEINQDAPIGTEITVQALAEAENISATHTFVVAEPTVSVSIVATETHNADFADNSTLAFSVRVFNLETLQWDTSLAVNATSNNSDILEPETNGQSVELSVKGHGEATLTITVDGATASEEVLVKCLKAPEALDLPQYIKTAIAGGSVYSIGLHDFQIDEVDKSFEINNTFVRFRNGDQVPHFYDLYSYNFENYSTLPLPINIIGDEFDWKGDCEVLTAADSGIVFNQQNGTLEFTKTGNWTVTVKSASGSKGDISTSFTVNVVDGLSVSTYEELRAIGQYSENVNNDGTARPITLNPVDDLGKYGFSLVPDYLLSGEVYDPSNPSSFDLADLRGMINATMFFFGNTEIIGNNVTIDLSDIPVLTGAETFTFSGNPYAISGDESKGLISCLNILMLFLPSTGFDAYGDFSKSAKNVFSVNKNKICNTSGILELNSQNSMVFQSMREFSVNIRDFHVKGNFSVMGNWDTQQNKPGFLSTVWSRVIQINKPVIERYNFDGVDNNKVQNPYIFPQCSATIDNISVSDFTTGLRVHRLKDGSKITNFKADNMFGGGLQVAASLAEIRNITMGAIGGAGLELLPEYSDIAGDESSYISSLAESSVGLVNQKIVIAGELNLLSSSANNLNTPALNTFLSHANGALTMQGLVNGALMAYNAIDKITYVGGEFNEFLIAGILGLQFGNLRFVDDGKGSVAPQFESTHLVGLYLKDLSNFPLIAPNSTVVDYDLDESGGASNQIASMESIYNNLKSAIGEVAASPTVKDDIFSAIVNSVNTTQKYISIDLRIDAKAINPSFEGFLSIGELIVYNPFFAMNESEVRARLAEVKMVIDAS